MRSDRVPDVRLRFGDTGTMDPSPGDAPVRDDTPSAHGGRGLRDEYPPRAGAAWALGVGALWGALGYSVLWEGAPFEVDRAFVDSAAGTLVLLPVRLVIWAIRWVELLTDRTFDLADTHLWIGAAASAVGALLAVTVFLGARALSRRRR
jgi:hypothetical protein